MNCCVLLVMQQNLLKNPNKSKLGNFSYKKTKICIFYLKFFLIQKKFYIKYDMLKL